MSPTLKIAHGVGMALALAAGPLLVAGTAHATTISGFTAGDLVVSVEGNGSNTGSYADNQAAPLSLYEFGVKGTASASLAGSLMLPQTASGANSAISGEYGSSSEGTLQLSGNGQYLTIMGYGVNAAAFNADPAAYSASSGNTALGQSGSLTGQSYTPVARVVALIGANGSVNTTTALYNIFNGNNPRSAYTVNGGTIYVSGQGTKGDNTGGVFSTTLGSHSATSITGTDGGSGSSQDTRVVQVHNNTLYVSSDSKTGSTNRSFIGTLGTAGTLPTSLANGGNGPTMLPGFGNSGGTGKITITSNSANGINSVGQQVNLSPEDYFFANATTLYVADSGSPKQTSATSALGDGGLQKWSLVGSGNSASWVLDYTLSAGLNLVANTASAGTTGLSGLTGAVVGNTVDLYATNYTVGDLDQTYLYGITDSLSATTKPTGESFTVLATAPVDSNFKGVSFAPVSAVPLPGALPLFGTVLAGLGVLARRRGGVKTA